ncbi:MAG: hypothetical protein ACRBF0_16370 [Calditrichia bacterium]
MHLKTNPAKFTVLLIGLLFFTSLHCQEDKQKPMRELASAIKTVGLKPLAMHSSKAYDANLDANLYIIGWSRSDNLAYLVKTGPEAADEEIYVLIIQNLVTDSVYVNEVLRMPMATDIDALWDKHSTDIRPKLKKHDIERTNSELSHFPGVFGRFRDTVLEIEQQYKRGEDPMRSYQGVSHCSLILRQNGSQSKTVDKREFKYYPLAVDVAGYVKSPFSDRIAIIVRMINMGWEGPPNSSSMYVVGAGIGSKF